MNKSGIITITINEQPVRLMFGMAALPIIYEKIGVRAGGSTYSIKEIAHIINAGYLNSCEAKDENPVLQFEDFYLYTQALIMIGDNKLINDIAECLFNSQFIDFYKEKIKTDSSEKKSQSTGKKLRSSATGN